MKRKIEFLNKLFDVLKCRNELLQFLKDEKIITDTDMANILNENHTLHASRIAFLLEELQNKEALQLVQYDWILLPTERMNLLLISKLSKKEFTVG